MKKTVDLFAFFSKNDVHENLGLGYIKSYLEEKGVNTIIHVAYIDSDFDPNKYFQEREPLIVGFSVYELVKEKILESAKLLKNKYPQIHICFGGPDVVDQGKQILETYEYIDSVCNGDGHDALLELTNCLYNNLDYSNCKGITFRKGDKIISNGSLFDSNLDLLPFPSRDLFEKKPNKSMFIMSSRECYGHCTFCVGKKNKNKETIKHRNPCNFVDELEMLKNKYNVDRFYFVDPTFEDPNINKAISVYNEIINRKIDISFYIQTRSEIVVEKYDKEYMSLAKNAGLSSVHLGIESGNKDDLLLYGKIASVEDNYNAVKKLLDYGFEVLPGFINFNPYSTFDRLRENIIFLKNSGLIFSTFSLLSALKVYKNSPIAKKIINDCLVNEEFKIDEFGSNIKFVNKNVEYLYHSLKSLFSDYDTLVAQIEIDSDKIWLEKRNIFNDELRELYNQFVDIRRQYMEYLFNYFMKCIDLIEINKNELDELIRENQFEYHNKLLWSNYMKFKKKSIKYLL